MASILLFLLVGKALNFVSWIIFYFGPCSADPKVTTVWKLKSDYKGLEELFKLMGKSKNDFHSSEVARGVLCDYIKKEDLGTGEDDGPVKLNEFLISALYRVAGAHPNQVLATSYGVPSPGVRYQAFCIRYQAQMLGFWYHRRSKRCKIYTITY